MSSATPPETALQQALARCALLSRFIKAERERALNNPDSPRNVEFGLLTPGLKKAVAIKQLEKIFDELEQLMSHVTILDMAAAFEDAFRKRLDTAIGEARKTLAEKHPDGALAGRQAIVRDTQSVDGLHDMLSFLEGDLAQDIKTNLKRVRTSRNRFAHGTPLTDVPDISTHDAWGALNHAARLLKPLR